MYAAFFNSKGKEMDLLSVFFFWNIAVLGTLWYWVVALFGFFLLWRVEYAINGGGSDFLAGFQEDFLWAIPGSRRRRGEYIRQMMDDWGCDGTTGSLGGYSYEDIRRNNLYEEVGLKMLPGPLWFWGNVFGWMFWPTAGIILLLALIIVWVVHRMLLLFLGETRTEAFYEKIFS